tara:strand:- start:2791 stop:3363 length:573 start_codon:yes stop_codon:yes gene_type:complete
MNKYIFASSNKNKLTELTDKLININLISLLDLGHNDDIVESGETLEENALIKAKTIYDQYKMPCISDDTGLEVYALGNAPGVFSARYAGLHATANDNIKKLLKKMQFIKDRRARFRTVICLKSDLEEMYFEGVVEGVITFDAIGEHGFGYDPVFVPNQCSKTFAEMSLNEKNKISHRGQAIQKLITYLNI